MYHFELKIVNDSPLLKTSPFQKIEANLDEVLMLSTKFDNLEECRISLIDHLTYLGEIEMDATGRQLILLNVKNPLIYSAEPMPEYSSDWDMREESRIYLADKEDSEKEVLTCSVRAFIRSDTALPRQPD